MAIRGMHHVSVVVANTAKSLEFYCGLLGVPQSHERPDLSFPGAWLDLGEHQIHLLEVPNPDPVRGRPDHGGRDRHVAFIVDDLDGHIEGLDAAGWPYTLSRSGRRALFCRDPDGNAIELIER